MASLVGPPETGSPSGSVRVARPHRHGGASEDEEGSAETRPPSNTTEDSTPSSAEFPRFLNIQPAGTEVFGDWAERGTLDPALAWSTLDEPYTLTLSTADEPTSPDIYEHPETAQSSTALHRWIRTLRRRGLRRPALTTYDDPMPRPFSANGLSNHLHGTNHHRQSSSGSSFGFVETVKTASASLASGSIFARSRRNSMRSSRSKTHTDLSSRASLSRNRCSEDSAGFDKPQALDKATVERSLQRRRILEELISTEESYIGDVRFLMNVYVTILVSLPTMPSGLRSSINRNLTDIIELHEELLGELHRAVPYSEYTQISLRPQSKSHVNGHNRIRSLDAVPEDNASMSWLEAVPGMVAEPSVVADVAQVFTKKV
jgi:hypothetical protein